RVPERAALLRTVRLVDVRPARRVRAGGAPGRRRGARVRSHGRPADARVRGAPDRGARTCRRIEQVAAARGDLRVVATPQARRPREAGLAKKRLAVEEAPPTIDRGGVRRGPRGRSIALQAFRRRPWP